ncbi:F-box/kelch-repeat protein [Melia azedarach]|uniref:F-box/kelch-repeat protein n=1 Tax=Melia azedarach TaxID=155640 RepID=A0ACC1Y395_MELAZ|nr:F-box/kelch-repeat protein [Melia azedarach]
MDLIPNLPNDIALDCLTRVSYKQFATISSVCKGWNAEISLLEFRRHRKAAGFSEQLLVLSQACVDQSRKSGGLKRLANLVYRVTLLELGSGRWFTLPPIPEFPNGLPLFCRLSAAGSDLVVIGGLDPVSFEVLNSVFVFNFVSATWGRGADMPGERRLMFGCASDGNRTVYVAGGHDGDKNALKSAMTYDVERDEWVLLPDMSRERDECEAVFHRGKFHVVGGYCTNTQGRFERHAEIFDVDTRKWNPVEEDFLESATCPRTVTCGGDDVEGNMYMCLEGDVLALKNGTWRRVAKLSADVSNVAYTTTWQGKLLVIGSARFGEPHMSYVLDLKSYNWTKMETPEEFSGHVQSGCYLEI